MCNRLLTAETPFHLEAWGRRSLRGRGRWALPIKQGNRVIAPFFMWHLSASLGMILSLRHATPSGLPPLCDLLVGATPRSEVSALVQMTTDALGAILTLTLLRWAALRTMVLPSLLKLLNVFLRQSTLTKAATSNHHCRPSCCPAALMPRPPGLPLSCRRGWEAREHPQRLPAEGREVRQRGTTEVTESRKCWTECVKGKPRSVRLRWTIPED